MAIGDGVHHLVGSGFDHDHAPVVFEPDVSALYLLILVHFVEADCICDHGVVEFILDADQFELSMSLSVFVECALVDLAIIITSR